MNQLRVQKLSIILSIIISTTNAAERWMTWWDEAQWFHQCKLSAESLKMFPTLHCKSIWKCCNYGSVTTILLARSVLSWLQIRQLTPNHLKVLSTAQSSEGKIVSWGGGAISLVRKHILLGFTVILTILVHPTPFILCRPKAVRICTSHRCSEATHSRLTRTVSGAKVCRAETNGINVGGR